VLTANGDDELDADEATEAVAPAELGTREVVVRLLDDVLLSAAQILAGIWPKAMKKTVLVGFETLYMNLSHANLSTYWRDHLRNMCYSLGTAG
jgi:hypothetical protein